eukprot:TRINITY_DN36426_c0_g1_i1.p1 TRINITY_DN36426_c0_g1~~TRINITY_DN36426_c0_g1_i1.p1  ORF type:complete len:392 (+),score=84.61 TRINITY_DN36426_c0_g1_i1:51-1178(+)
MMQARPPPTLQQELKGAISNILLAGFWTAPIALLPGSALLITAWHGAIGMVLGLLGTFMLLGGPMKLGYRLFIFLVYLAAALKVPAESRTSALAGIALLFLLLAAITELPGRPKHFQSWPGFCSFITGTCDGRLYYKATELRGALADIKPGKNLFAVHPHGILATGWTWNLFYNFELHEKTGCINFLIDEGMRLKSPTFRMMCDWFNVEGRRQVKAATREEFKKVMAGGESLAMLPGGFQEASICERGKDRVYIKNRKGFIKYCLQAGYRITPVYTFGESDTFRTFSPFLKFRLKLAAQNIPAAAMLGNLLCPLIPLRHVALQSCVGAPLQLPQIAEPTKEDIDKWHGKYMEALKEVFDKHKADVGKPKAELEFF